MHEHELNTAYSRSGRIGMGWRALRPIVWEDVNVDVGIGEGAEQK